MKSINFDEIVSLPNCLNLNKENLNNHLIVLYGAGVGGECGLKYLERYNIKPVAVCDTYKVGQDFFGYKVCGINDIIRKYDNMKIFITSIRFFEEIKKMLLEYFTEDMIISFIAEITDEKLNEYKASIQNSKSELNKIYNILNDEKSREAFINVLKGRATGNNEWFLKSYEANQYFPDGIVTLENDESFIDGGAFVGDTAEIFIAKTNNIFKRIYCFEPSNDSYNKLADIKKKNNDDERMILFKAGLYSDNLKLGFYENAFSPAGNTIIEQSLSVNSIDVVSIDKVIKDKVTFIKMDIEGAELEALKGARETILKYRPKLAISVYHKDGDLIDIPNYIMSLGLDYKYYLRHHNPYEFFETVFYAI